MGHVVRGLSIDTGRRNAIALGVRRRKLALAVEGLLVSFGIGAGAEPPPAAPPVQSPASAFSTAGGPVASPESRLHTGSLQYGAGLTAEMLTSAGPICSGAPDAPCVVGSGGGLVVRFGYRFHAPFHVGAAYECAKLDAHKTIVLPILQQLRAETRVFVPGLSPHSPFLVFGAGAAGYGGEWSVQTFGAMLLAGVGLEWHLAETTVLTTALTYRPMVLKAWADPTGQSRPSGVVSLVGLEISVEQRQSVGNRSAP
jgi:hypothetical protein